MNSIQVCYLSDHKNLNNCWDSHHFLCFIFVSCVFVCKYLLGSLVARYAERLWVDCDKKPLVTSISVDTLAGAMDGAPLVRRGLILTEWYEGKIIIATRMGF